MSHEISWTCELQTYCHGRCFHEDHQTKCDVVHCIVISCYAKEVVMSLQWRMSWARRWLLYWFVTCPEQSMKGQPENIINMHLEKQVKESHGNESSTPPLFISRALTELLWNSMPKRDVCRHPSTLTLQCHVCHAGKLYNYSLDALLDNFWFFTFLFCFRFQLQRKPHCQT